MSRERGARPVFDPRMIAALVAAGLVAFALFMVLMAYAGDLRSNRDGRAHALSGSPNGFKGIVRLIELGGGYAPLIRSEDELDSEDLLVVTAEPQTRSEAIEALLERRVGKATLIVLPKWEVAPDPVRPGRVRRVGTLPESVFETMLGRRGRFRIAHRATPSRTASGRSFVEGLAVPLPEQIQTVAGGDISPLLTAGDDAILLGQLGDAPHYLLAEPDLLNNQGIKDSAGARAALALLGALNSTDAGAVRFDLTLNGFARQPSALKLAFEPPFLPLTIALAVAALLAGLHGAFRFGPAAEEKRAIAFGKGALVENSAGLLKIAKREQSAGAGYAELIRETAAHDSGAHLALHDAELDAYLDRLSPAGRPRFSDLVRQARLAEDRSDLLAAARALFQWKKDLIK